MEMGNSAEPPPILTRDLTESDHDRMKDISRWFRKALYCKDKSSAEQKLQGLYPWLSSYRNTQKTKNKILNLFEFPANKDLYSSILRGIFLLLVKANIYWVLLCAWHCSKSFTWIDSFTPTVLYNRCYYPCFADKETEPQGHSSPKWRSQDWTRAMWFLSLNLQPPCCMVSVLKWKGNPTGS